MFLILSIICLHAAYIAAIYLSHSFAKAWKGTVSQGLWVHGIFLAGVELHVWDKLEHSGLGWIIFMIIYLGICIALYPSLKKELQEIYNSHNP